MTKPDEDEIPEAQAGGDESELSEQEQTAQQEPEKKIAEPDPERELAEAKDQLLRTLADMENLRARTEREQEQTRKFAIADFARAVVSVADNLRRAIETAADTETLSDEGVKSLIEGLLMTEKELLATLDRYNIQKVDPMGERFDHDLHQAIFEVETVNVPPGTVVEVMQVGYTLNDRLLRPAMVGVAKAAADQNEGEKDPDMGTEA